MTNSAKNRSQNRDQLPEFTRKELSRLEKTKPSAMLLKAARYLHQSDKECKAN